MNQDPAAYCLEQVRRFDRNRYLCALFAPEADRPHLLALYAFNVEISRVREIVTEPVIGQMRLQWWRDALAEFREGKVRAHPVAQALAAALQARPVRAELLERMLVAREFDLADTPPDSLAALEQYAEGTSASLMLAALDILSVDDAVTQVAARELGIAWALIGLLRAVPFHASQRRVYLPRDLLATADLTPEAVIEGQARAQLPDIVATIAACARRHLDAAAVSPRALHAARAVLLLRVLARRHLARLEHAQFDPLELPKHGRTTGDIMSLIWAAWRNEA